jgi:replicative DNA helicase
MEKLILSHLIDNETYGRKVLPFLKPEYFQSEIDKTIFDLVSSYTNKYNQFPTKEALYVDLESKTTLNEETFKSVRQHITELSIDKTTNLDWLVDKTEEFCQEKAIFNALRESIKAIDKNSKVPKGAIPKLLQDALQVSFDSNVGHDFVENAPERYDLYHKKEIKLDFDIEYFNKITGGGVPQKTLCCLIATTGGGKSLAMCHMASHNLMCGKNVLYITLEMAEERIAQRIDANLLDVTIQDLMLLSKLEYQKKMEKIKKTTKGKLIIKEYPTASAGSAHFRHLLNELKIKKNFVPDVIYIDYLNLCISSRIKHGAQVNTYSYVKAIAEELRGLAVEFKVPIWTATQANRGAFCLDIQTTMVQTPSGNKLLKNVQVGDILLSDNNVYNIVKKVYPIKKQHVYRITTESGREIICSGDHRFPTGKDMINKSVHAGLKIGDELKIK